MDVVAVCTKLASIFDRLAHESTSDIDVLQTVAGLKRITKGEMPSRLLRIDAESRNLPQAKRMTDLRRKIVQMRAEKENLETVHAALLTEHARVKQQLERLQASQPCNERKRDGEHYSYAEVMDIIRDKFGKHNGGLTLWAEYSAKIHAENSTIPMLTTSQLQSWRTARQYPAWAVNQLLDMPVTTRATHKWSEEDIEFLVKIHLANPYLTDEVLAEECSKKFDCNIGVNSIKSKFNILRKQGRIPMLRPEKPR